MSKIRFAESTEPTTPPSGKVYMYADSSDNQIKQKTDDGVVVTLSASATTPTTIITVAATGGDYTSIKTAVDSITDASSSNRYSVTVAPGVYTEAPITMKNYVDVIASSSQFSTKITASTTGTALFTGSGLNTLQGFILNGVTGNAAVLVDTASYAMNVKNCTIYNCQYGLHCTDGLITAKQITTAPLGSMTSLFYANGGTIQLLDATLQGTASITTYGKVDSGGVLSAHGCYINGSAITTGFENDASTLVLSSVLLDSMTTAVHLKNVSHTQTTGLVLGDNATTHVKADHTTAVIHLDSGTANRDKMDLIAGYSDEIMFFQDDKEGDQGMACWGEFAVGRPENGKETVLGEGDSYTRGMLVYTFNGSTYTDVSTEAKSPSGSTFAMPGLLANNAIYVGSDLQNGSYLKFYGIKCAIETAAVLGGGEIVAEYWNGAWVEFDTMSTQSGNNYYPYGKALFERTGSEQIRNDKVMLDDWAVTDPPSTGTSRYWIRYRIKTAITTAPIFQQFKLHTNRYEVNADGFAEYFGASRPVGVLPWGINSAKAWASSPSDQDLFYLNSTNGATFDLGVGRTENNMAPGNVDKIGIRVLLPYGMDTSCPINVEVYWVGSSATAGDVVWRISSGTNSIGDGVGTTAGAAPTTITDEYYDTVTEAVGANENGIVKLTTFTFRFPTAKSRQASGGGDLISIAICSDGSTGTDTYPGNRFIDQVRATYSKWCEGGHS